MCGRRGLRRYPDLILEIYGLHEFRHPHHLLEQDRKGVSSYWVAHQRRQLGRLFIIYDGE